MSVVVSFVDYRPPARFDSFPWTDALIYETDDPVDGTWTLIDTVALSPTDADPEDPAYRSFTTENGTDDELWYRVVFADGNGDTAAPTVAVHNVAAETTQPYATTDELFRILKIRTPTDDQTVAAERVLLAAAGEIDNEIDLADDASGLSGWQLSLVAEVNLERAVEHWRQQEASFGLIALDGALGPAERIARDSWERHALKLAPLKSQWGLA